jgi:4-hydroxy-tetrahydrodipicolinate synthase
MMQLDHEQLRGIIPPMVTPLLERDRLDCDGLERLIKHVLGGGVHGLFLLGTTGEVPVLVGITDTCFEESLLTAYAAADCGADAVVLAPPYYFPAGQAELLEYLEHLVAQLPLPLVLYNMPSHTKLIFEPETVRRIAEHPSVIGLKDSSADMVYFHRLKRMMEDLAEFSLLVGPEQLLAESLLLGADGGVCGGANFWPELYVSLYEAARARDLERVAALHQRVIEVCSTVYTVGRYGSSTIKGVKCALSCLGVCSDFMAEPFHRFREGERERVGDLLARLGFDLTRTAVRSGRRPCPAC